MQYWCIFCSQLPERLDTVKKEFAKHELHVNFWQSIHAASFGISAGTFGPTDLIGGYHSTSKGYIGLMIGFWTLWQHLLLIDHPGPFLIFEDDVLLEENFKKRIEHFFSKLPADWQILLVGSPWGGDGGDATNIKGEVRDIGDGNCWGTHAILFRKSALRFLLDANHRCEMPIDAQLNKTSYRQMKTYALTPSLAMQRSCLRSDDPRFTPCSCG